MAANEIGSLPIRKIKAVGVKIILLVDTFSVKIFISKYAMNKKVVEERVRYSVTLSASIVTDKCTDIR